MTMPNWSPLARFRAFYELSREDGGTPSTARRREDGIRDVNVLAAQDAVALARSIRGKATAHVLADSTTLIRNDRDAR